MHDFALVCEGVTDQAILKSILIGYFEHQREPDLHREFPDPQAEKHFGGWTLVLRYLREKKFRQAFQLNRYLIVQIDTDVAEDTGFDVPRQNQNGTIPLRDFIGAVAARLAAEIGDLDWTSYGHRFIFAIGVEQLECWLLPVWYAGSQGQQTVNCTSRLGRCPQLRDALNRKNYRWISKNCKNSLSYEIASKDYSDSAILRSGGPRSPSLAVFLEELDKRAIMLQPFE